MAKLFAFNMITLDGYFEGPNHDLSWHNVDQEFGEFAVAQLKEIDTLIFGRSTYEMMASYWSTPAGSADDPVVAGFMNGLPKIVVSRTLRQASWNNSRLLADSLKEELTRLKDRAKKDLAVFGSARLLRTLIDLDLVDEHRVIVAPIVLGGGTPLFQAPMARLNLKLSRTRIFGNGNVLLCYERGNSKTGTG